MVINRSIRNEGLYKSAILVTLNRNISGSKMKIQERFSPRERASNPLKMRYFPPRIPFPVLGHSSPDDHDMDIQTR